MMKYPDAKLLGTLSAEAPLEELRISLVGEHGTFLLWCLFENDRGCDSGWTNTEGNVYVWMHDSSQFWESVERSFHWEEHLVTWCISRLWFLSLKPLSVVALNCWIYALLSCKGYGAFYYYLLHSLAMQFTKIWQASVNSVFMCYLCCFIQLNCFFSCDINS